MNTNSQTIQSEAAYQLLKLDMGLSTTQDTITWADSIILKHDNPPIEIIDLALTPTQEFLAIHKQLENLTNQTELKQATLRIATQFIDLLIQDQITLTDLVKRARSIYLLDLNRDLYDLIDLYDEYLLHTYNKLGWQTSENNSEAIQNLKQHFQYDLQNLLNEQNNVKS
ncbi:hypothetical protein JD969_03940 [Planctomycetota bacterium]|nr:hypothetical protein JD969_03940 [Planctomycetota bacterium]